MDKVISYLERMDYVAVLSNAITVVVVFILSVVVCAVVNSFGGNLHVGVVAPVAIIASIARMVMTSKDSK